METDDSIAALTVRPSQAELLAERKGALLRQGEMYRVGVAHAQAHVKDGLRPEVIVHRAIDHAGWALRSRFDRLLRPGAGASAMSLLPAVVSLFGLLARRKLLRPALGVAAAAVAVGWYSHRQARRHAGIVS